MKVHFIRSGERRYSVRVERADAPTLVMDPAPGFDRDLPHDLVHFVVEGVLGLKAGVFGQIAAGGDAGGFRVDAAEGVRDAKDHRRTVRKQAAKRSEEHTSELQSLMRTSYAVFCLKKKQ